MTNGWRVGRIAFIGAGKQSEFSLERVRRLAAAASLSARDRRVQRFGWLNRGDLPVLKSVQAATEGMTICRRQRPLWMTSGMLEPTGMFLMLNAPCVSVVALTSGEPEAAAPH